MLGIEGIEQLVERGLSLQLMYSGIGRFDLSMPMLGTGRCDTDVQVTGSLSAPERPATVCRQAAQADSVQPRRELGLGVVGVKALVCDHEYILKHVFEVRTPNTHALQGEPDEVLLARIDADQIGLAWRRGRAFHRGTTSRPMQR